LAGTKRKKPTINTLKAWISRLKSASKTSPQNLNSNYLSDKEDSKINYPLDYLLIKNRF